MNLNKLKNRKFTLFVIIAILVAISLLLRRRLEVYEGEAGPSKSPGPSQTAPATSNITQEDLDSVLKFIKGGV